jgi:hypothetical protein
VKALREAKEDAVSATLTSRRNVIATSAAAAAISLLPRRSVAAPDDSTVRRFKVNVPADAIADMRQNKGADLDYGPRGPQGRENLQLRAAL